MRNVSCFTRSLLKACFQRSRVKQEGFELSLKPLLYSLAEKEGFEPPVPFGTTVFKTAALDRSAISPGAKVLKFQCRNQNSEKLA